MKGNLQHTQLLTALIVALSILIVAISFFITDARNLHRQGALGLPRPRPHDRNHMNQIAPSTPPTATTTTPNEPRP